MVNSERVECLGWGEGGGELAGDGEGRAARNLVKSGTGFYMITVWQQPVFNKIFAQNIILLYNREMFPVLHVIFHQLDSYSNMKDF